MPNAVDRYLAALPAPQRRALEALRALLHEELPGADEAIKTRVPALRIGDATVVGFGAAQRHLALYVMFGDALVALRDELAGFDVTTRVLRFTPERPIPTRLLRKILKFRVAEIQARPSRRSAR